MQVNDASYLLHRRLMREISSVSLVDLRCEIQVHPVTRPS